MELTVQILYCWSSISNRERVVKYFIGSENLNTPFSYDVRMNFYRVSIEYRR